MSVKIYNPRIHVNLRLTTRSDEIACLDYGDYRALLSCGHACDPNSLTRWCKTILDNGDYIFTCPALNNGVKCGKEWSYDEVRSLGLLNDQEKLEFEETMNFNYAKGLNFKECPNCKSFIQQDGTEQKIKCLWCEKKGVSFYFCRQCENKWIHTWSNTSCGNFECSDRSLDALRNCKFIYLSNIPGLASIPSIRACPTCGKLIEHNGEGCKNVVCRECTTEFCFACLLTTVECQSLKKGHNSVCVNIIAPIQTQIPGFKTFKRFK